MEFGVACLAERLHLQEHGYRAWHDCHGRPQHHSLLLDDATQLLLNTHKLLPMNTVPSTLNRIGCQEVRFACNYRVKPCAVAKSRWAAEMCATEERLMTTRACNVCYYLFQEIRTRTGPYDIQFQGLGLDH